MLGKARLCLVRYLVISKGSPRFSRTGSPVMSRENLSSAWYVAETQPQGEAKAQSHLARQGFATFCPRFRKQRHHARRIDDVLVPVFPGYLFIRFDCNRDGWPAINGTRGIRRLVAPANCRPQPMPEPAMAALLDRCRGEAISGLFSKLEPGQMVRLVSGPFATMLAQVEEHDDRGRVRVLLELLGRSTPATVGLEAVGPA